MFSNSRRTPFLYLLAIAVVCTACTAGVVRSPNGILYGPTVEGGKYGSSRDTAANAQSTVPPSRAKDLIADFGLTPVKAWGTGDCQVKQGSTTIHCKTTTITPSDVNDLFVAVAANTGSTNLDTTITGYIDANDFTIGATPVFTTTNTKIIDQLTVPNSASYGSNYSFTGTQCLTGGTIQTQECGAFPKLMTVVNARVNQGGSGGNSAQLRGRTRHP